MKAFDFSVHTLRLLSLPLVPYSQPFHYNMPDLGDSKWTSNPTNNAPSQSPESSNNGQAGDDKHVSVPPFGFSAPRVPASKSPTSRTAMKPPSRAEVAGKAAGKRMDELQRGSHTFSKAVLYQKYGQQNTQVAPLIADPSRRQTPVDQARLHALFRRWVPRADEFYNMQPTLRFSDEEIKAIQDEIVSYRVQSAIAAGTNRTYVAPWEQSGQTSGGRDMSSKDTDEMDVDGEDPFDLGLVSSPKRKQKGKGKGKVGDAMDLLD